VTLKSVYQVLWQKEFDLQRVREEVAALHTVIPLLAEASDWFEQGGVVKLDPPEDRGEGTDVAKRPA
jgi:hypothetical protein